MSGLTERQLKAIPHIVAAPTYTEGIRRSRISRKTFYEWLKDPAFKQALAEQRHQVADEAFGLLAQNVTHAIEVLTALLDSDDERTRRGVANDVIAHFLKYREEKDLRERLDALEEKISR